MTRLQKLLSQIKTADELAEVLKLSPRYITDTVGASKDRGQLIPCKDNCAECAFYQSGHCISNFDRKTMYLNAVLPEPVYTDTDSVKTTDKHVPHESIIKLRDSARKLMKTVVIEGFNQGHTAQTVFKHLDEYIDVLEGIGLFEENELRTYVATDLLEVLIERRKKTK